MRIDLKKKSRWVFPTFIIVCFLIGIGASFLLYQVVDQSGRNSLIYRAETIALTIGSQEINLLSGDEEDIGSDSYENLKQKLIAVRESNPDTKFLYIVGKKEGNVFFYVDSEHSESEDYSPPGEIYYEESEAFDQSFEGIPATEGPVKDRWGVWISGTAPIRDRDSGDVVAVVGIDADASTFIKNNLVYASVPLLLAILLAVCAYVELRVRREDEKVMELKSQFVSIASHELRSPLAGMEWSLASLSAANDIPKEQKDKIDHVRETTKRLLTTVNDILKATSFEAHKKNLKMTKVNLLDLIKNVVQEYTPLAAEKKISFIFNNIENTFITHAVVLADNSILFEALQNIVVNAIKYSRENGEIVISCIQKKNKFYIEITDGGIGIPAEEQAKVFNGFFRAANARVVTKNGSGLGLFYVKKIIEAHEGTIHLRSEEGKGTTITICLPKASKL